MIDLANPKTPLESAKIAGYLTVMSGLGGKCPYPVGDDFYIAYKEGVALAQSLPKPKKGEIFTLGHYSGVSCTVCFDDLTIGDPVVLICKMYGLLVHSALYKPSVVKGVITRVNGRKEGKLIYAENVFETNKFSISTLRGARNQAFALRYIGDTK